MQAASDVRNAPKGHQPGLRGAPAFQPHLSHERHFASSLKQEKSDGMPNRREACTNVKYRLVCHDLNHDRGAAASVPPWHTRELAAGRANGLVSVPSYDGNTPAARRSDL